MTRLSIRLANLEARSGQGADALSCIEVLIVEPTPNGPRYTGDVLVKPVGEPWQAQRWETRPELVGKSAADAKAGIRI